jgi:hypothetical protein
MITMVISVIVFSNHTVTKTREVPAYAPYNVRAEFNPSTNSSLLVLNEENADMWAKIPGAFNTEYKLNMEIGQFALVGNQIEQLDDYVVNLTMNFELADREYGTIRYGIFP